MHEQAKILHDEAEENNLDEKRGAERWRRWNTCSMCEQQYHGVVRCALGWACWKTYVGRPEADRCRRMAMTQLGNGLCKAKHSEDALSVEEAQLAMMRRIGAPEGAILGSQSNIAASYASLKRFEDAQQMMRDVYFGYVRLYGKEHRETLRVAENYALSLFKVKRFEEAKSMLRRTIPVAQRVLGKGDAVTLKIRWSCASALCQGPAATLDDLREAVTTGEETERVARRVLGGAHPTVSGIEYDLQNARAALAAREGDVESVREAVEAMAPGDA